MALAAAVLVGIVAVLVLLPRPPRRHPDAGVNGLSLGAIYALGAVGLTLVYGILKLVNFAHGDFLTFGAYMAYLVNVTWELPLVLGVAFAIAIMTALLGIILEKRHVGADAAQGRGHAAAAADGDRPRLRDPLRNPVHLGDRAQGLDVNHTGTVGWFDLPACGSAARTLISVMVGSSP